jgi:hypothetical protein
MLFGSEVPVATDDIIKHAANQTLCPNIAASPEMNNRARIKRRSQVRCKYLV